MTLCTRTTPEPGTATVLSRPSAAVGPASGVLVLPGPTLDEGLAALLAEQAHAGAIR